MSQSISNPDTVVNSTASAITHSFQVTRAMAERAMNQKRHMFGSTGFRNLLGGWPAFRGLMGRLFGGAGWKKRDYYDAFGWDRVISSQDAWEMYTRGGIAKRIIHAYPNETWANPPEVSATKQFTNAWDELAIDQNLWSVFNRLDVLSRIGQYAILVVGLDDSANLESPARQGRANKVTYLQPWSDRVATITKWGEDPTNERFGLPVEYTINVGLAEMEQQAFTGGMSGTRGVKTISRQSYRVHWSRVIHYSQGGLENEVFGIPMLWSVWNYLTDLNKVIGGSSESYWQTSNRGMHVNVDPDMEMDPDDEAALSEEVAEYHDGMQRFIRTRGVEIKNLGSDVANPEGPFKVLVAGISGTTGIPQRILSGSEAAHQASTQDKGSWAERVEDNRRLSAEPYFLRPTIQAFMRLGVLPTVKLSKLEMEWPSAYRMSPLEAGQAANQRATAANNFSLAAKNAPNLLGIKEVREAIGFDREQEEDEERFEPPINPIADPNNPNSGGDPGSDNGTAKGGPGSGVTATPTSDSNGNGDAVQGQQ